MKSLMRLLMTSLTLMPFPLAADSVEYSANIAIKTDYLGKIGTTVDNHNVLQPYVELSHENGFYGSVWFNLPLKEDNPMRSFEFEPSIGYRAEFGEWNWTAALTLFDLQNPKTLDFSGDVLSPSIKLSRGAFYTEALYYAAEGAEDGWLTSVGFSQAIGNRANLTGNLTYVDAPFHFEPIWYSKLTADLSLKPVPVSLFVEFMDILAEKNDQDTRTDQVALGMRYFF